MKAFAHQHNGIVGGITIGDDGKVLLWRHPKKGISPTDGDITNVTVMQTFLRHANRLKGVVSEDLRYSLQRSVEQALVDAKLHL